VDAAGNYHSGDDYVVEFLGYRFSFSASDFEERVTAAAVKLGLLAGSELDPDETADLVELVERDGLFEPRSALGRYLVRHWEELALVDGESLVYWLKKLVFRGAWLDHRVKEGLLELDWDEEHAEFTYADPNGGRALVELLPTPSWHERQYRR
jgi:Arc/MetJ-type ribon-helix-helix transcriptional regulator